MVILTCVLLLSFAIASLANMEGHMVEGSPANIHQHAHSAHVNIRCVTEGGLKNTWNCGSSIVNQYILLTAAHCLYRCNANSFIMVHAGSENRHMGQSSKTYAIIPHPEYNPQTSANDICLIRVKWWFELGSKVRRVAILRRPPYFEQATVAGWGKVDESIDRASDQLMFMSQKVWNQNRCVSVFGYMPKGTICASNENESSFVSAGDSGSALIVRGFIQIGIVSYKVPSVSRHVIVYTDVGFFYDWIQASSVTLACVGV